MSAIPTTALLDSVSLQIDFVEQYAEMLHEIALDVTTCAPVDSHTWLQQDRVNALINAVRIALDTAKQDVEQANSQLLVDPRLAFQDELSTPDAGARIPIAGQAATHLQEATA